MGGSGPNRPKATLHEKNDRGEEREAKQRNAPVGKQERNNLRCNTDPQTNKRRTRRKNSTNEPRNTKDNDESREITHPEAAIAWGRRTKRNREKQKKIARQEKKTKKEREI